MILREATEVAWLHELARRVAEIAASPENARICRRWRNVNALRRPDRPPVWCRPVGAWDELLPEADLLCADPFNRQLERELREILIKHEIGDDTPVESWWPVRTVFDRDPANTWGLDVPKHAPPEPGGAWTYDPPLRIAADFDRLRLPAFTYNHAATEALLHRTQDALGDALPVRRVCDAPLGATLGTAAADLRGLTQLMLDCLDAPELFDRLMGHLRDGVLGAMRQVTDAGLLTPNNTGPMTLSDPVGDVSPDGRLTPKNLWCMANSQEFDQVSPRLWRRFLFEYQRPILAQFGHVGYGCCENLTKKMDDVLALPNLRIFVCSAWTNLDRVIEKVGDRHVIMWRQKASDVVFAPDEAALRRGLEDGLARLRGCHVQIVLRELQTLAGHRDRLHVWTRLAITAAEKYADL
jgi:hypothetical protein